MMNTQPNEAFRVCVFAHHNRSEYVALDDFPNYYDLTFVLSGSLCYLIDGKMTDIVAGNAVFYSPGAHRIRANIPRATAEYISINFFHRGSVLRFPATDRQLPDA